jgi:hypothetical protein
MTYFYAPSTRGFYHSDIHVVIPEDAISISEAQWESFTIKKQAGFDLKHRVGALPVLVEIPKFSDSYLKESDIKAARKKLLEQTDGAVARHRDQKDMKEKTTLTEAQFKILLQYRKDLRDITDDKDFPNVDLPAKPDFL